MEKADTMPQTASISQMLAAKKPNIYNTETWELDAMDNGTAELEGTEELFPFDLTAELGDDTEELSPDDGATELLDVLVSDTADTELL